MSKIVADASRSPLQSCVSGIMAPFANSVSICSRTGFSVATGMSANGTTRTSATSRYNAAIEGRADIEWD